MRLKFFSLVAYERAETVSFEFLALCSLGAEL